MCLEDIFIRNNSALTMIEKVLPNSSGAGIWSLAVGPNVNRIWLGLIPVNGGASIAYALPMEPTDITGAGAATGIELATILSAPIYSPAECAWYVFVPDGGGRIRIVERILNEPIETLIERYQRRMIPRSVGGPSFPK